MKCSLESAVADLRSESSTKLSEDQIHPLCNEHMELVTFWREAVAICNGQSSSQVGDHDEEPQEVAGCGSMSRDYSSEVESCTKSKSTKRT